MQKKVMDILTEKDIARFWSKVNLIPDKNGCLLWKDSLANRGYGQFKRNGKTDRAHRIALMLSDPIAFKNRGDKNYCCHTCDVKACCNPEHLFWGTQLDNMQDMTAKGRHRSYDQKGSKNHQAKLTERDVLDILERLAKGEKQAEIAREYKAYPGNISKISKGIIWKHVFEIYLNNKK